MDIQNRIFFPDINQTPNVMQHVTYSLSYNSTIAVNDSSYFMSFSFNFLISCPRVKIMPFGSYPTAS